MNSNLAVVNPDVTCFKCLKGFDKVKHIMIHALGWGSGFDNFSTQINLCHDCYETTDPKWWELKVCGNFDENGNYDEHGEWYEFEGEIFKYVNSLPIAGQELFYSRYSYGACAHHMEPQDWIDYNLDILPHEKCKEYGRYSPQERTAYRDRFPTCGKVFRKTYSDGSSCCKCNFGAHGTTDGECDKYNISKECYMCKQYIPRLEAIKVVNEVDEFIKNETERLEEMLKYATDRLEAIKKSPKEYFDKYDK